MSKQPEITTALWLARDEYLESINEYERIHKQITPLLDEMVVKKNIKRVLDKKGVVARFEDLYLASDKDAHAFYKEAHELYLSLGYKVEMNYSPVLIAHSKKTDASHKFIHESFYLVKNTGLTENMLFYNLKTMRKYLELTLNMLEKIKKPTPTPQALLSQIAFRFNVTEDKVSNIQIDDEHKCVTADIKDICKHCNCGWIEEYGLTLEEYKEKTK